MTRPTACAQCTAPSDDCACLNPATEPATRTLAERVQIVIGGTVNELSVRAGDLVAGQAYRLTIPDLRVLVKEPREPRVRDWEKRQYRKGRR